MNIDRIRELSLEYAKGSCPPPPPRRKPKPGERGGGQRDTQKRSTRFLREYGIALRHYRKLLSSQNRSCAICGVEANREGKIIGTDKKLSVDHCHTTGRVRGLLCGNCNSGLGMFRDDQDRLQRAIEYLKRDSVPVRLPKLPKRLLRKYGQETPLAQAHAVAAFGGEVA